MTDPASDRNPVPAPGPDKGSASGQGRSAPSGQARSLTPGQNRSPNRSARRRAREFAMQGLYQWLLSHGDVGAIQAHIETTPGFARADRGHFETLLGGAIRQAGEIDRAIEPHLDRPINLLSPVEHATLMVGCYELLSMHEIPYRVVINEAVELAKDFGGTDGYKYVNGVLDCLAGTLRPNEVASARR